MIFCTFLIVVYDLKTGNGRYTIQPSGYCTVPNPEAYNTWHILSTNAVINKGTQTITFIIYIYYFYKLSILNGITNRYHNKYLILIVMTMGASIINYQVAGSIIGTIFLIIQQCVIMISFTCTPKTRWLCKELFSRDH